MNEYNDADAFDGIINHGFDTNPQVTPAQPYQDPNHQPYGPPAHHQGPVKTGLTPRGKAALSIAATLMAGGGLLGWQHYAAGQAASEVKAKELAIEQQRLDLEKLKALGEANKAAQKTQTAAAQTRQKLIDSCVEENKGLVGKQLGATYRSVLEDCQAQYPDTAGTGADMEEAASASTSGGGGVNDFVLIGGGVLALGLAVAVKRGSRRPEPAPVVYRPY